MSRLDDPQALLSALVSIPSVSGQEGELADAVQGWVRTAGLGCERIGDSLVVRVGHAARGKPRLLFNSHLDTVPIGAGWDADPLDGTWRDGRLCARGANDAKASVAAMLCAAHSLRGADLAGELLVALNSEEETSNAGMAAVLEQIGRPDAAVTGEPTGLQVVRAQSGLVILEARWSGRSCHAAHVARVPYESALLEAARAVAAMPDHLVLGRDHPLLGRSTIAPTVLKAGDRHNVVPDEALLVLDGRIAPPFSAADCVELVREHLSGADVTVRSSRLAPVETEASHPLVAVALAAAGRAEAIGSSTMSDMALLRGTPAIKCGPGETARSHTPNEHVMLEELEAGTRFYFELAPRALAALTAHEVGS